MKDAIDSGYRHIDTAYMYENEEEIGRAVQQKIAENVVTRSEMFIVTKVSFTCSERLKQMLSVILNRSFGTLITTRLKWSMHVAYR